VGKKNSYGVMKILKGFGEFFGVSGEFFGFSGVLYRF
jgi:hypothetical protein